MSFAVELQKLSSFKTAGPGIAKKLLQDPGTCALALLLAAKSVAGEEWHDWEPETLWLTLEQHGIDVPVENRAKIQAGLTLRFVPSFYWDGIVFEKTALAFDGHAPNPDTLEEATVAQLAWAVAEGAQIVTYFGDPIKAWEHEPKGYSAIAMCRQGFVRAPDQLKFAQDHLDRLNPPDRGEVRFRDQIEKAWEALDKTALAPHTFSEDPLGVQLALLAGVELYIQEREARAAADLAALHS